MRCGMFEAEERQKFNLKVLIYFEQKADSLIAVKIYHHPIFVTFPTQYSINKCR